MTDDLLLTFYGDDFTGSTDVMESLARNGVRTVLFLDPPDEAALDRFDDGGDPVRAIGVAGRSRTMSPAAMDEQLPQVLETLYEFDAPLVQYKVCSTFDSSPAVGSIGRAIDVGQEVFDSPVVPVVVAAPSLEPRGRYVLFGNLFATVDGTTYRLDRHPTMRDHPVTPMTEADLPRHLGEQTDRAIGSLDVRSIDGASPDAAAADFRAVEAENEVVVFDGLNGDHQRTVGELVWERALAADGPVFSASSSGLTYALARHWRETSTVADSGPPDPLPAVEQILVVSGSASPVTRDQIDWAVDNGFEAVRLDAPALVDPGEAAAARDDAVEAALAALEAGESVVCHSARGSDDPAIAETRQRGVSLGLDDAEIGERLGKNQGRIARRLLEETGIRRACVAGGDTSGYVAPQLDVFALEFGAPVGPGSPLCVGRSRDPSFDGVELALKGGQVQTTDAEANYFGVVRDGGTSGRDDTDAGDAACDRR